MDSYVIVLLLVLGIFCLLGFIEPMITYIGGGISVVLLIAAYLGNPQAFKSSD